MDAHTPYETFIVTSRHDGAQTTIDRLNPQTGHATPAYVLHKTPGQKTAAVLRASAGPSAAPAGTFRHHSLSAATDVSLRGGPLFKMQLVAEDYPARRQVFASPTGGGGARFTWGKDAETLSPRKLSFRDAATERVLGRYAMYPDGRAAGPRPTFALYVPPGTVDVDMFVVTGVAAMDLWAGEDEAGFKLLGKLFSFAG
ncbi:hypothetical protein VDGD_01634 [Verticillium dahliae]|nr:hypothetical protein VDGD_01634 [Verticillium dahliae]